MILSNNELGNNVNDMKYLINGIKYLTNNLVYLELDLSSNMLYQNLENIRYLGE